MGAGRYKAAQTLATRMQKAVDMAGVPVEILNVGLEEMHPPIEENLPQAFHEVVQAEEQRHVEVLKAETEAVRKKSEAVSQAVTLKQAARQDYGEKVYLEKAQADRFVVQSDLFKDAVEVFKSRRFLSAMEEEMAGARKLIVGVQDYGKHHMRMNLEDPAGVGLEGIDFEEVQVSGEEKKK